MYYINTVQYLSFLSLYLFLSYSFCARGIVELVCDKDSGAFECVPLYEAASEDIPITIGNVRNAIIEASLRIRGLSRLYDDRRDAKRARIAVYDPHDSGEAILQAQSGCASSDYCTTLPDVFGLPCDSSSSVECAAESAGNLAYFGFGFISEMHVKSTPSWLICMFPGAYEGDCPPLSSSYDLRGCVSMGQLLCMELPRQRTHIQKLIKRGEHLSLLNTPKYFTAMQKLESPSDYCERISVIQKTTQMFCTWTKHVVPKLPHSFMLFRGVDSYIRHEGREYDIKAGAVTSDDMEMNVTAKADELQKALLGNSDMAGDISSYDVTKRAVFFDGVKHEIVFDLAQTKLFCHNFCTDAEDVLIQKILHTLRTGSDEDKARILAIRRLNIYGTYDPCVQCQLKFDWLASNWKNILADSGLPVADATRIQICYYSSKGYRGGKSIVRGIDGSGILSADTRIEDDDDEIRVCLFDTSIDMDIALWKWDGSRNGIREHRK